MPREPLKIPPLPPLRMRAPQKLGSRGKMRKERRRPAAAAFASSDSIKAAFMAACEAGELEKVLDLNFWSAVIQIQIPLTQLQMLQILWRQGLPLCLGLTSTWGLRRAGWAWFKFYGHQSMTKYDQSMTKVSSRYDVSFQGVHKYALSSLLLIKLMGQFCT